MILDSGNRTEFSSGAVRDVQDAKGEPSLIPLMVVAQLLNDNLGGDNITGDISDFVVTGKTVGLYRALTRFANIAFGNVETMLLEVSIHYSEGAKKYGRDNWQKGLPTESYLNSMLRHYWKWRRGDKDEPHDRAFCWNIMCCIWEVDYHEH